MDDRHGLLAIAALLALATGCATSPAHKDDETDPRQPPKREQPRFFSGKILSYNAVHGYVVVECAVLPRPGEEATVFRGEKQVGRVRFDDKVSFPYSTARLLEGHPTAGDRVRNL